MMTPALTAGPVVFIALIAAAALHAGWNAFLKLKIEPFMALTLMILSCAVIGLPFAIALGAPRMAAWPWMFGSIALHLFYNLTLAEAYRRAEMSQVYPVARGGAPLLTAIATFILISEPISPLATAGVVVLGFGVILISLGGRKGARMDRTALGFALATATIIAFYTLVDGLGARVSHAPGSYTATLFVLDCIPLTLVALWRRGLRPVLGLARHAPQGLFAGAMAVGSYWIAIWAMTVAPIAVVAALRGTGVLFSVILGAFLLKEKFPPARWIAAGLIVVGIGLIH